MIKLKNLFAILLLLCSTVATAHNFEVDGIYYNITDATNKTVAVTYKGSSYTSYEEYSGDVVIPKNVIYNDVTYSVTNIESYAFYKCTGLTSVTIPNSITNIQSYAFDGCKLLNTVINFSELTLKKGDSSHGGVAFYAENVINYIVKGWCIDNEKNFRNIR
jgi:hypothetical protein